MSKPKIKPIMVYLPEDKHTALKAISDTKRQPITRLVEAEIDKLLKREAVNNG